MFTLSSAFVIEARCRQYSAFGKVVKGMEFVDMIKKGEPNSGSVSNPDKIISLRSK